MRTVSLMIAASAALLAGCAPQLRLAEEDRRALSAAPQIHVVHYLATGGFTVESTGLTAAAVLFTPMIGLIGAFADGAALRQELRLEDPVPRAKERLASVLADDMKLGNLRIVGQAEVSDVAESLREKFQTGLIFDVRTTQWGLHNHRAKYGARARLLRLADSAILWQSTCEYVADEDKQSPTREALVANDGVLLKAKLIQAAEGCADRLAAFLRGKDL